MFGDTDPKIKIWTTAQRRIKWARDRGRKKLRKSIIAIKEESISNRLGRNPWIFKRNAHALNAIHLMSNFFLLFHFYSVSVVVFFSTNKNFSVFLSLTSSHWYFSSHLWFSLSSISFSLHFFATCPNKESIQVEIRNKKQSRKFFLLSIEYHKKCQRMFQSCVQC